MLLDLSEIIIREGMRVSVDVDQPSVEDPDLNFAEPLRGRLTFTNGGEIVSTQGRVESALSIPCSRCLTDVRVPIELQVDEHFPIEEIKDPTRQPEEGEDFDSIVSTVVYLEQGRPILDLDELLRQLVVIEVPIRALCSDACEGICPQCGTNRNTAPCTCEDPSVNTPLAGLGALLSARGASGTDGE